MQQQLDDLYDLLQLATESGYAEYDSLFTVAHLVRMFGARRVLELGTFKGCSAVFIARELPPDGHLVTVDRFDRHPAADVAATLERFGVRDRVTLVTGDTRASGPLVKDFGPFDCVFFDASHTDDEVLVEWESVRPFVAPRALLLVDDSLCVMRAINAMGMNHSGMRSYAVHFGLCAIVVEKQS